MSGLVFLIALITCKWTDKLPNVININISKALSSIDIERVGTRFIPLVRSIIPVKIVLKNTDSLVNKRKQLVKNWNIVIEPNIKIKTSMASLMASGKIDIKLEVEKTTSFFLVIVIFLGLTSIPNMILASNWQISIL